MNNNMRKRFFCGLDKHFRIGQSVLLLFLCFMNNSESCAQSVNVKADSILFEELMDTCGCEQLTSMRPKDYSQFIMPLLILFIILTVFVVVKSQKYNHNIFDENGKWKKGASKQLKKPTIILAITFIGVGIIMYFSLQPTGIETTEEGIEIAGMYGDSYAWSEMEQVTLLEELPKVAMRTNGSAIGSKLKGHFKFENGEKAKLFVDKSIPPFISFVSQGNTIIFNLETEQETLELYEQLRNKTTK